MKSNFRDYPSLNFVCDDIRCIANSLSQLLRSTSLSRADRVSLSVNIQKLRSHVATIYAYKFSNEMHRLFGNSQSNLDKDEDLPF